jgi:hypothetical protein
MKATWTVPAKSDVKEIVGALMRILDGGEISQTELDDLAFEADGELEAALNDAYIKLLEFVHDGDVRLNDREIDRRMRSDLQECLDRIVRICDSASRTELK